MSTAFLEMVDYLPTLGNWWMNSFLALLAWAGLFYLLSCFYLFPPVFSPLLFWFFYPSHWEGGGRWWASSCEGLTCLPSLTHNNCLESIPTCPAKHLANQCKNFPVEYIYSLYKRISQELSFTALYPMSQLHLLESLAQNLQQDWEISTL